MNDNERIIKERLLTSICKTVMSLQATCAHLGELDERGLGSYGFTHRDFESVKPLHSKLGKLADKLYDELYGETYGKLHSGGEQ